MSNKPAHRLVICALAALFLLSTSGWATAQIDLSGQQDESGENSGLENLIELDELSELEEEAPLPQLQQSGQQVHALLYKELDNAIPGAMDEDAELKKAISDALAAFEIKDFQRVSIIFQDQEKRVKDFPPTDLLLAILSFTLNDAKAGAVMLERAAVNRPEYPGNYIWLSRLALTQNRISDALALLEKAERKLAVPEMNETARNFFMSSCLDGFISVAMKQNRFDDARKYLDIQRKLNPDSVQVLMLSAELEFKEDKIEKSIEYLKRLISKNPELLPPELIVANWYKQKNNPEKQEEWVRIAAEKYPNDPRTQLQFAAWCYGVEDFHAASSAIANVERIAQENVATRSMKGKIAFCNQSYAIAESHFQAILEQQPKNFDAANMFALSLIESEDEGKQRLAYDLANSNYRSLPDNLVATAALGYICLKRGELELSKTLLARASQAKVRVPEINYYLALHSKDQGDLADAKANAQAAAEHKGVFLYRTRVNQLLEELVDQPEKKPES